MDIKIGSPNDDSLLLIRLHPRSLKKEFNDLDCLISIDAKDHDLDVVVDLIGATEDAWRAMNPKIKDEEFEVTIEKGELPSWAFLKEMGVV